MDSFPDSATIPDEITRKPRVLVVDDEPTNVKLLSAMLRANKFQTLEALGGIEALRIAETHLPDIILLDVMMPVIDGFEVTKSIKGNPLLKNIPVILLTALDASENKLKGLEAGAEEFLNKPVNMAELLTRINSMLRLKQYKEQLLSRKETENVFTGTPLSQTPAQIALVQHSILLIEDNPKDVKLITAQLPEPYYRIHVASSGAEAVTIVEQNDIELALLDIMLPGETGFEVCRKLKECEKMRTVPIVFTTSLTDLDSRIRGLEVESDGYLIKPINGRELRAKINLLLKKKKYLDDLYLSYEMALNSAMIDSLTQLYNKAYFRHAFDNEIKRAQRQNYEISLIMIDIDNFKKINDTHGHLTGDIVLREVGRQIKTSIREIDLAARYGGEEFAVILPYSDVNSAVFVGERIRSSVASYSPSIDLFPQTGHVTVSLGLAAYPQEASDMESLVRRADEKLYLAKRTGKDRLCY